jgi:SAM-dependent methyltransferase
MNENRIDIVEDKIKLTKVIDNVLMAEKEIECHNLEKAKLLLNEAINIDNKSIEAIIDLAVINIIETNYDEALINLKSILQLEPGNEIAISNLDYLLENKLIPPFDKNAFINGCKRTNQNAKSEIEQAREVWNNFDVNLGREVAWLAIKPISEGINKSFLNGNAFEYLDKMLVEAFPSSYKNLVGAAVVCGDMEAERGIFERVNEAQFTDVVGFDISEKSLERVRPTKFNFHPVQADCNDLVIEPNQFELVIGLHGIHHVYNVGGLFYQINKSLKLGGILYIHEWIGPEKLQIPRFNAFFSRLLLHMLFSRKERTTHENRVKGKFLTHEPEAFDPSEACNSLEITRQLSKYFNIKAEHYYGALCYPMFEGLGRNFNNKGSISNFRFKIVLFVERLLLAMKIIKPLFLISISQKRGIWK